MAQPGLRAEPSCGELNPREGIAGGCAAATVAMSQTALVKRNAVIDACDVPETWHLLT